MNERVYSHIVPKLSSSDARVRRAAIEEFTRHADQFERSGMTEFFEKAIEDDDEDVARAGRWGMAQLFRQGDDVHRLSLTGSYRRVSQVEKPDDNEMLEVRRAAYDVLRDSLDCVHTFAVDDSNTELAHEAIRLVGRLAFRESLEPLYKATRIKNRSLTALRCLGAFDDDEVFFLMRKFLRRFDDLEARCAIMSVLAGLRSDDAFNILEQHTSSPSAAVRATVARSLWRRSEERTADVLMRMLEDSEPDVVMSALDSLAIIGASQAVSSIVPFTAADHDRKLRARATAALGFMGTSDSLETLFRLLEDTDPRVVANAVDSIHSLNPPREDMIRHGVPLLSHPNNRVRGNVIRALSSIEEGRAMAALKKMLTSPMRLDRASAAWVAGEVATVDAAKWLVTLINTELEASVLSSALSALERMDRPEVRPALNRLFGHPHAAIRAQAVRVFSVIADGSGLRQLESLFVAEKVQTVRSAIVSSMGNVVDSGNFMIVTRLLHDANERVVANAIESLDRMGSLEVTPFLTPYLQHGSMRIKANTIIALWKLGDLKVAQELKNMMVSDSSAARKSALYALRHIADFLSPTLLAERPLLRSSLRTRFKQRSREGTLEITEMSRQYGELFRMEEEEADHMGPREGSLGRLLRERAKGDDEAYRVALSDALTDDPRAAFALYLARRDQDIRPSVGPSDTELRNVWVDEQLVGGLHLLLRESKEKRDLEAVLTDYLALIETHVNVYQDLVKRAREHLATGRESVVQAYVKYLVERIPLQDRLHETVAEVAFGLRDFELAYDHLLRHVMTYEQDWAALIRLCSAALRRRDLALASAVIYVIERGQGVPADIRTAAVRLRGLIEEEEV